MDIKYHIPHFLLAKNMGITKLEHQPKSLLLSLTLSYLFLFSVINFSQNEKIATEEWKEEKNITLTKWSKYDMMLFEILTNVYQSIEKQTIS